MPGKRSGVDSFARGHALAPSPDTRADATWRRGYASAIGDWETNAARLNATSRTAQVLLALPSIAGVNTGIHPTT